MPISINSHIMTYHRNSSDVWTKQISTDHMNIDKKDMDEFILRCSIDKKDVG